MDLILCAGRFQGNSKLPVNMYLIYLPVTMSKAAVIASNHLVSRCECGMNGSGSSGDAAKSH